MSIVAAVYTVFLYETTYMQYSGHFDYSEMKFLHKLMVWLTVRSLR